MKHYGDITKIKGSDVPVVDVICGGSPCQDLSVAGKRRGLAGERSGLFMEQIRIIKEMREHDRQSRRSDGRADEYIRPRYMVWENVPGAFSSNGGKDFHAVLEETAKVAEGNASIPRFEGKWPSAGCIMGNGWSIAWRVHDAQFWGVPQRRKRISLVADFGGDTAPEILFERKGVSGDIAQGGKEGERTSGNAERCTGETGTEPIVLESNQNHATIQTNGISTALPASAGMGGGYVPMVALTTEITPKIDNDGIAFSLRSRDYKDPQSVCCFEPGAASRVGGHVYEDISGTVRANAGDNQQSVCYGISPYDSNGMKSDNPHAGIYKAETARTLDLNGGSPACNQGGMAVVQGADLYNGNLTGDVAATLTEACGGTNTSGAKVVCLEGNGSRPTHQGDGYSESETMYTLNSTEHHAVCIENHPADSRVKISDDGKVQTLSSRMETGGGNVPMVMEQLITASKASYFMKQHDDGKAETLVATDYKDPQLIAYGLDRASFNQGMNAQYDFAVDEEKIGTQVAKGPGAVFSSVVRRLTPMECERLQGYPDHWTDIGDWVDSKGKTHKGESDSPRYKALGNSIALPFWSWMAGRMVRNLRPRCTMASLFDGIGGFPFVFLGWGCEPVWASEIEEFPIAVTKIHFPEDDHNE